MAGALEVLDDLGSTLGDVAGNVINAAGAVASAKVAAAAQAAVTPDKTPVGGTSPIQTAQLGLTIDSNMILLLLIGASLIYFLAEN